MIKDIIENYKIDNDFTNKLRNYRKYNEVIANYYFRLGHETLDDIYFRKASAVTDCNKVWFLDYFKDLNIKNFNSTFLCKNKFCFNCKKVTQALRMAKYSDYIRSQENLYHLVLTVPNCKADELESTLKNMASSFKRFYRILNGIDTGFTLPFDLEVIGAIRSLEITFSDRGFHPHYHVLISLKDKIKLKKNEINKFSYSFGELTRTFSELELYLQKMWQCLFEKKRLSKINEVTGYSVILDEFKEGDFLELFKYMCKEKSVVDIHEGNILLSYEYFKALYFATYRKKQIQGYGIFWRVTDESLNIEELRENYDKVLEYLSSISAVENRIEFLDREDFNNIRYENEEDKQDFLNRHSFVDLNNSTYISFKKYVSWQQKISKE